MRRNRLELFFKVSKKRQSIFSLVITLNKENTTTIPPLNYYNQLHRLDMFGDELLHSILFYFMIVFIKQKAP